MKLKPFPRFNSDDYREAESWFGEFLESLNQMVDSLNPLFQNGIDLDNNISGERQTVTLSHNTPITVRLRKLTTAPFFVRVGYAAGFIGTAAITGFGENTVTVTVFFHGTLPSGPIPTMLYFES